MELKNQLLRVEQVETEIYRLTLTSPEDRNALSEAMRNAILAALEKAHSAGAKVVIVDGGGQTFSSGYKLDAGVMRAHSAAEDRHRLSKVAEFLKAYRELPLITIAQVQGYCVAGGTDFMLANDIVVVADDAKLGVPNVRGLGISLFLPVWSWLVGPQRAKLLSLAGDLITGKEAAQNGLVAVSYEASELGDHTLELAQRIAMVPHELLVVAKHALNSAWDSAGFHNATNRAVELDVLSHLSAPVKEFWQGVEAQGLKTGITNRDQPFAYGRTLNDIAPPPAAEYRSSFMKNGE